MDDGHLQRTLGKNLRTWRTEKGLSQEAFADVLGYHRTYVGGLERGERNVTLKSLERIARTLDVDPASLLAKGEASIQSHRFFSHTREELESFRPVARILHQLQPLQDRISGALGAQPERNSPWFSYLERVSDELGPQGIWGDSAPRSEIAKQATSFGISAAENLRLAATALTTENYFLSIYPSLRTALEASAAQVQLLDKRVSDRERALRVAWMVHDAANHAKRSALTKRDEKVHRAERNQLRKILEVLVDPRTIKFYEDGSVRKLETLEQISITASAKRLATAGGASGNQMASVYGYLSSLTHPNSRRIQATYSSRDDQDEDVVASVCSVIRVVVQCYLFSVERTVLFFGIQDAVKADLQLTSKLTEEAFPNLLNNS